VPVEDVNTRAPMLHDRGSRPVPIGASGAGPALRLPKLLRILEAGCIALGIRFATLPCFALAREVPDTRHQTEHKWSFCWPIRTTKATPSTVTNL